MRLFYPPLVIRAGLNVNHLPGYSFKDLSPSWQTGSRLALHAIGATAGNPPKAPPERRRPRPGEGQGEPVNAAFVRLRQPYRPVAGSDRLRLAYIGKAQNSIHLELGEAFPKPTNPPSSMYLPRQKTRGDKSLPGINGVLLKGYSASAARQAEGGLECGELANP